MILRVPVRRGLPLAVLVDLWKALIQVKAHVRKDGTQVKAHSREVQTKAERAELVKHLAQRMAAGEHTRHKTLASALGAARHASKANGREAHVYEHPEGGWVATHDGSTTEGHHERIRVERGRAHLHARGKRHGLAHIKGRIEEGAPKPVEPKIKPAKPRKPKAAAKQELPDTPGGRMAKAYLAQAHTDPRKADSQFWKWLVEREEAGEKLDGASQPTYYNDATKQFMEVLQADLEAGDGEALRHVSAAGFRRLERAEAGELKRAARAEAAKRELDARMAERYTPAVLADEYLANAADDDDLARDHYHTYMSQRTADGLGVAGHDMRHLVQPSSGRHLMVQGDDLARLGDELQKRGWRLLTNEEMSGLRTAKIQLRRATWQGSTVDDVLSGKPGTYRVWRGWANAHGKHEGSSYMRHANYKHLNLVTTDYHLSAKHAGKGDGLVGEGGPGGGISRLTVKLKKPLVLDAAGLATLREQYSLTAAEAEALQKGGLEKLPSWVVQRLREDGYDAVAMGGKKGATMALLSDYGDMEDEGDMHTPEAIRLRMREGYRVLPQDVERAGLSQPLALTPDEWAKQMKVGPGDPKWGRVMALHRDAVYEAVKAGQAVPEKVKASFYRFTSKERPTGPPAHEVRAQLKALTEEWDAKLAEANAHREALEAEKKAYMGGEMYRSPASKWDDTYRELSNRYMDALRAVTAAHLGRAEAVDRLILHPEKLALTASYDQSPAAKDLHDHWDHGIERFRHLVGPRPGVHNVHVRLADTTKGDEQRAHYANHRIEVMMGESSDSTTMVHELGHWLEYSDPDILKAAVAFVRRRTAGEAWTDMKTLFPELNYRDGEYTKKDQFISPYVGKLYGADRNNDANDEQIDATEAISMGLERMHHDAAKFAWDDPEHFDLIWGILRKST